MTKLPFRKLVTFRGNGVRLVVECVCSVRTGDGMHFRRDRLVVNQYSGSYHLNRPVKCVDCGVQLHKSHHFVLFGHRCSPCYHALLAREAAASTPVAETMQYRESEG